MSWANESKSYAKEWLLKNYFAVTSECVMAWTESAMRF